MFCGISTFDSWEDFERWYKVEAEEGADIAPLERYRGLCPDWVFTEASSAESVGVFRLR